MIKRLHSFLLFAKDLTRTADFYEKLGFAIDKDPDAVRIKFGDFRLAFIDEKKAVIAKEANAEPKGLGVFTYFEVEDVDAFYQMITNKGITASGKPKDWPWGKREFAVKDPDGYKLIFFSATK